MSKNKKNKAKLALLLQQANKEDSFKKEINTSQKNQDAKIQKNKDFDLAEDEFIKKDIKKVFITTSVCLAILLSVWMLNTKTNYISTLTEKLTIFSNIKQ